MLLIAPEMTAHAFVLMTFMCVVESVGLKLAKFSFEVRHIWNTSGDFPSNAAKNRY